MPRDPKDPRDLKDLKDPRAPKVLKVLSPLCILPVDFLSTSFHDATVILRLALGLNTLCLRLAYVFLRKPDVSQLCVHRVLIGGWLKEKRRKTASFFRLQRYKTIIRFANIFIKKRIEQF